MSELPLLNRIKMLLQDRINENNRKRLNNTTPTIIASNCNGGFISHWLNLQFLSPTVNLWICPVDFIQMLEDFDYYFNVDICKRRA